MEQPRTRVAVLGSTGSVGRQTLDVVRAYPDRFEVVALAAGRNVDLLAEQAAEFRPRYLSCADPAALRDRAGIDGKVIGLADIAVLPEVQVLVSAVVGKDGLAPARDALLAGKAVALANKEAMVMAGDLLQAAAKKGGGEIRPVDSEHSAVWQCLAGEPPENVEGLVLTASGGALRDLPLPALAEVGPKEALAHPTWQMGPRITIDSATLFNKGLEVIEAHWLFDMPYDRIDVVLHRESIIHSLVQFVDGSFKAQLSSPDMKLPIQYALTYPERLPVDMPPVDFAALGSLNFGPMDMERYSCLGLALAAGRRGGTYPAALVAADEEAVGAFLAGRIGFMSIPALLTDVLESHESVEGSDLEDVMEADAWGRRFANGWIEAKAWT